MRIGILLVVIFLGVSFALFYRKHPDLQIPTQAREQAQTQNDSAQTNRVVTGIGVLMGMHQHALEIMEVISNSPAARAGLHRGMIVQQIDGVSVVGKPFKDCIEKTRGPAGSTVQLEVADETANETNTVVLTRAEITLPPGHTTVKTLPAPN